MHKNNKTDGCAMGGLFVTSSNINMVKLKNEELVPKKKIYQSYVDDMLNSRKNYEGILFNQSIAFLPSKYKTLTLKSVKQIYRYQAKWHNRV